MDNKILKRLSKIYPELIDKETPWRFNPELDEDMKWDILFKESPYSKEPILEQKLFWPGKEELPEKGDWIWIIRPPHTVIELEFGGIYFAKPFNDGIKGWYNMKYSVDVFSKDGTVRIWPYEYAHVPIEELIEFWSEGNFKFNMFNEQPEVEMTERLFYIMSRGIPVQEAFPMALGDVKGPVGWFSMVEKLS